MTSAVNYHWKQLPKELTTVSIVDLPPAALESNSVSLEEQSKEEDQASRQTQ